MSKCPKCKEREKLENSSYCKECSSQRTKDTKLRAAFLRRKRNYDMDPDVRVIKNSFRCPKCYTRTVYGAQAQRSGINETYAHQCSGLGINGENCFQVNQFTPMGKFVDINPTEYQAYTDQEWVNNFDRLYKIIGSPKTGFWAKQKKRVKEMQ